MAGLMCTLVVWGLVVDRRGERFALLAGMSGVVAAGLAAVLVDGPWQVAAALFVAGACSASTNAASGRIVVGWFPPSDAAWRWASGSARSRSASVSAR